MANQLKIHADNCTLPRGDSMVVPITLTVEAPLKTRGIHARFWGAEETKAVYYTRGHKGSRQRRTAVQHVTIVDQPSVLAGNQQQGFFHSLGDSLATVFGGGQHEVLQPGEYPFELDISLPALAPPTHTGQKSRVFYELSVWVDVPLGLDLKATQSFTVPPLPNAERSVNPVRVRYPDDEGRGFWDSIFAPDVRVELALAADAAKAGDLLEGLIVIQSERELNLHALTARFACVEQCQANGHHDSAHYGSDKTEIARPGLIQGRFSQAFSLPVVLAGPPSLQGTNFSVHWYVEVSVEVPWAKDPTIRAPIWLF